MADPEILHDVSELQIANADVYAKILGHEVAYRTIVLGED